MVLTVGFIFALGVFLPVFMDSFNESRERTAWVSSIIMAIFLFFGPVIGVVVNRFGCRVARIIGCLSCAVGLGLGSLAPNIIVLYVAFCILFGFGTSFIYLSSPLIMTHYFNKRRSVALGIVTAGQGLGTMICGPVLQVMAAMSNWRKTFLMFAGILALSSLTGCFLKHDSSRSTASSTQGEKNSKKFGWNIAVCKNPKFLVLLVMSTFFNFVRMIPYVHLIKHCDDLGIPADKSSTLFTIIGIFAAIGRLCAGCLCDLKYVNSRLLYQASVLLSSASIMLLTVPKTYTPLAAVVIIFSLGDGLVVSTFVIELFKSVKESERALCLGFCMMAGGALIFCGPPLAGLMADRFGNYIAAFLVAGGVGVVSSPIPFLIPCFEPQNNGGDPVEHLEELMDKDICVSPPNLKSTNGDIPRTVYPKESVESLNAKRTSMVRAASNRPVSFMWAMESPYNL